VTALKRSSGVLPISDNTSVNITGSRSIFVARSPL
jgi:hypothetical protein